MRLPPALSVRVIALGDPEANPAGSSRTLRATALELSAALWRLLRLVNSGVDTGFGFPPARDGRCGTPRADHEAVRCRSISTRW
jgi:hypothetical protein